MKQCWSDSGCFAEGLLRLSCGITLASYCSSFDGWASWCFCLEAVICRPPILCLARSLAFPPSHFLVSARCRSSGAGVEARS